MARIRFIVTSLGAALGTSLAAVSAASLPAAGAAAGPAPVPAHVWMTTANGTTSSPLAPVSFGSTSPTRPPPSSTPAVPSRR